MDVKVGDEVILDNKEVAKVAKVTPTGRIRIDKYSTLQFNKNGDMMGGNTWNFHWIKTGTDTEIKKIKDAEFVRKVRQKMEKFLTERLTYEIALKLNEIMEKG